MNDTEATPLFENLSPAARESIEEAMLPNSYPAGAVLFAEGDIPQGVYIVRRGHVKLTICDRDGRTVILRLAGPGEALGVAASVTGRLYEATALVQEYSETIFIHRRDLRLNMRTHGELALWATQQISMDYNATLHDIRGLLLGSASGKLARLLVGWIDPKATPQAACKLKVSLTHEEIGQMIGTSRETVTRLMGDFKRQHLIEQSGATLTIPSRVALEHLIPL